MKILTICPSIYPEKLEKMMDGFEITRSKDTELVVVETIGSITKIYNDTFNKYPDYDFYHLTNDDTIYHTPLWDKILANKGKISYGNDMFQGKYMPTFPMIDGDIVRALGWLVLPTLGDKGLYGDNVWQIIGNSLKILNYVPEVIIEHKWNKEGKMLDKLSMEIFAQWLMNSNKDINKIKEVLCQK